MPRQKKQTAPVTPNGIVRLVGRVSTLRISSPSKTPYVFKRGEDVEIVPGDWRWFAELGDDFKQFEVVIEPSPEEPLPSADGN